MRRIGVVVLGALALAGSANATSSPFPGLHLIKALPIIDLPHASRARASCSAHARNARTRVTRFDRKIAPVACEQPPRPKVRDAATLVLAP